MAPGKRGSKSPKRVVMRPSTRVAPVLGELDALASEMATSAPEPAAAAEAAAPAAAAPQGSGDLSDLLAAFGEVMPEQPAEPEPEREREPEPEPQPEPEPDPDPEPEPESEPEPRTRFNTASPKIKNDTNGCVILHFP